MADNIANEKLSKDNYDSWKLQIEVVLVKNDLWDFVTGQETIPEADDAAILKWTTSDQKALADLILSIHPLELNQIKSCVTSHELWTN